MPAIPARPRRAGPRADPLGPGRSSREGRLAVPWRRIVRCGGGEAAPTRRPGRKRATARNQGGGSGVDPGRPARAPVLPAVDLAAQTALVPLHPHVFRLCRGGGPAVWRPAGRVAGGAAGAAVPSLGPRGLRPGPVKGPPGAGGRSDGGRTAGRRPAGRGSGRAGAAGAAGAAGRRSGRSGAAGAPGAAGRGSGRSRAAGAAAAAGEQGFRIPVVELAKDCEKTAARVAPGCGDPVAAGPGTAEGGAPV